MVDLHSVGKELGRPASLPLPEKYKPSALRWIHFVPLMNREHVHLPCLSPLQFFFKSERKYSLYALSHNPPLPMGTPGQIHRNAPSDWWQLTIHDKHLSR